MTVPPNGPSESLLPGAAGQHRMTADQFLDLFRAQDAATLAAVHAAHADIARLGARMAETLTAGGRVIYCGAGTSGRLGALDAAEWGPTFGVAPGRVLAVVAGGDAALRTAVEGAEDSTGEPVRSLELLNLSRRDLVVGISASGTTPFVRAALSHARRMGSGQALVTASPAVREEAGLPESLLLVVLAVGPELVAGSTRLKSAAATQLALQRASTLCAHLSGWIHAGRMVEMRATNQKLRQRARRIVSELAGVDDADAAASLASADGDIKVAIVSARLGVSAGEARQRLDAVGRRLASIDGLDA